MKEHCKDCNLILATVVVAIRKIITFGGGCLGSYIDEERSEMRYVMRIAISRESLIS